MPEKQKARSWKELQTIIAAAAMMLSFAICNLIATFDRRDDDGSADDAISSAVTPTAPAELAALNRLPSTAMASTPVVTSTKSS